MIHGMLLQSISDGLARWRASCLRSMDWASGSSNAELALLRRSSADNGPTKSPGALDESGLKL